MKTNDFGVFKNVLSLNDKKKMSYQRSNLINLITIAVLKLLAPIYLNGGVKGTKVKKTIYWYEDMSFV